MFVLLIASVVVPFLLWREEIEIASSRLLGEKEDVVTIGVLLLVGDAFLPIPSSLVATALCIALGPVVGGISVATGSLLSFALGYGMGRLIQESTLRSWVGQEVWTRVSRALSRNAWWWISVTRPLPVLAEVCAVCAGAGRVHLGRALLHAGGASMMVGGLYSSAAYAGSRAPTTGTMLIAVMVLPAMAWTVHRVLLRRLPTSDS